MPVADNGRGAQDHVRYLRHTVQRKVVFDRHVGGDEVNVPNHKQVVEDHDAVHDDHREVREEKQVKALKVRDLLQNTNKSLHVVC